MKYHGGVFDVAIGAEVTTITRRQTEKSDKHQSDQPINVRIGTNNTMAGDYPLVPGQALQVPTRRPDRLPPQIEGNIAQCRPVTSKGGYTPGHYPLAAVDGSNATSWQPLNKGPATLDIDLGYERIFKGVSINWGMIPAEKFSLYTTSVQATSNSTDLSQWTPVLSEQTVEISEP